MLFFHKYFVVFFSLIIIFSVAHFSEQILTFMVTPLPKDIRGCLQDKFSNNVSAQNVCSGTTDNTVVVWTNNGQIQDSNLVYSPSSLTLSTTSQPYLRINQTSGNRMNARIETSSFGQGAQFSVNARYSGTGSPLSSMLYDVPPGQYNTGSGVLRFDGNGKFWTMSAAPTSTGEGAAATMTTMFNAGLNTEVWLSPRGISSDLNVNSAGNVGLGTTTPGSNKLSVTGRTILLRDGTNLSNSNEGTLELRSTSGEPYIAFHAPSVYGAHFGLELIDSAQADVGANSRWLSTKGWSAGSTGYTGLRAGIIDSRSGYYYLNGNNALQATDAWLRINNSGRFTNGIYSPGLFRADGGLQTVTGAQSVVINANDDTNWTPMRVTGTRGGYSGINFDSVSRSLMMSSTVQGVHDGANWVWYFTNGSLTAGSVPWGRLTSLPSYAANSINNRVRMVEVGCGGSWASSCDGNTNGIVDSADSANTAVSVTTSNGGSGAIVIAGNQITRSGGSVLEMLWTAGGAVRIGGSSTANLIVNGTINGTTVSDQRLKKEIKPLGNAFSTLSQFNGVTYQWKNPGEINELYHLEAEGTHTGFIAQEVEEIYPDWVTETSDGHKVIKNNQDTIFGMFALIIEALKEFSSEVKDAIATLTERSDKLEQRVTDLEQKMNERERYIQTLEDRLERLENE